MEGKAEEREKLKREAPEERCKSGILRKKRKMVVVVKRDGCEFPLSMNEREGFGTVCKVEVWTGQAMKVSNGVR